jgi:cardiolipin synthase
MLESILNNIYLYHGLILFGESLILFVLIHMLYQRRTPANMIAWLLSMVLVPYIFVVLYFVIGARKRKNIYQKGELALVQRHSDEVVNSTEAVLRAHGVSDANKNEHFELYTDSVRAYESFMACIKNAKKSIYISTYVLKYDDVTKNIFEQLIRKAEEGVEVRMLIDSIGSWALYFSSYKLKALKKSGVKIEFFMPIFRMPFRNYINLRNHRKIYLFDNKKVLSGGMNLSNEYFGPVSDTQRWEDMLFLIEGQSSKQFFDIFASDWLYASGEKLDIEGVEATKSFGNSIVQVIPSGPDMPNDALYEALLCAIYAAQEKIWIVTPYFIPDATLIQALIIAKKRGLDIKLITPKKSNQLMADLARSSYLSELEEVGIDVWLYEGVMLHAKAMLIDHSSVMLGSVNLDNRSLFLNYEVATLVYSSDVITEVEKWMITLKYRAGLGREKTSKFRRILENFMRIIAPQM